MLTDHNFLASLSTSEQRLLAVLEDRLTRKLDARLAVIRQAIDEALAADEDDDDDEDSTPTDYDFQHGL